MEVLSPFDSSSHYDKRTALIICSPCHQIQAWIQDAGMDSWVDAVGNVHGRLNGSDPSLPALFLGSHYDTVLDAGRLVWSGLCVVQSQYLVWLLQLS